MVAGRRLAVGDSSIRPNAETPGVANVWPTFGQLERRHHIALDAAMPVPAGHVCSSKLVVSAPPFFNVRHASKNYDYQYCDSYERRTEMISTSGYC